jgi:hypothetical protein
MPSPFPGMDPYLENTHRWKDFHQSYIIYIRAALVPRLPPDYIACVEERVYLLPPSDKEIIPDAHFQSRPVTAQTGRRTAVVVGDYDPPVVLNVPSTEARESYIEIRNREDDERVVTVIEVLSPTNKAPNSRGREVYLEKQQQLLISQANLIEIDLLRGGEYTIAAPQEVLREESRWDYLACLHRGEQMETFEVWPISLRERLPRIAIPLDFGIPDLSLDLQAVLNRCYDESGYDARFDYTRPPVPPLQGDDVPWAEELLRNYRENRA